MDYYLENLRTGETNALNPDRNLIGTADHATIQTEGSGPFLAALIVNYPSGWLVHGLADGEVTYNGKSFGVTQQVSPRSGDVLAIGEERFRFVGIFNSPPPLATRETSTLSSCFAYIRFPDEMEECRVVDHNLLFGRLHQCHVRYPDTKLSRLNALLAAHGGVWYVHPLGKGVIGRNRHAVSGFATLEDGDELLIGPLVVRIELRAQQPSTSAELPVQPELSQDTIAGGHESSSGSLASSSLTDAPTVETTLPATSEENERGMAAAIYGAGVRLDQWLKAQSPDTDSQAGLSSWFGAQREKLKRFWLDTPETTSARVLRLSGRAEEAFQILDRALRNRPESPDLLRELYRLYESVGLFDLCFRPLRQIEKLASARGGADPWVLETLARLCERLGRQRASMFDRAMNYWNKLERATGTNYAREKAATMATRALSESGFAKTSGEDV